MSLDSATLYVTLQPYLESLRALERSKREPRHVPSIDELASDLGIPRSTLYSIAGGKVGSLNLSIAGRIIAAMRSRGFPMEITDLLAYRE